MKGESSTRGESSTPEESSTEGPLPFPQTPTQRRTQRRRRGVIVAGSALALLVTIVAVLYFSPLLVVRTIAVSEGELLDQTRAQQLLGDLSATPIAQVSSADAYRLLSEDPAVKNAQVRLELPSTVHVEITEHEPVVELRQDGQLQYYNAAGELVRSFEASEEPSGDAFATPEIISADILDDEAVFTAITETLGDLPEVAREELEEADAQSLDSITLTLNDGREVLWGSAENSQAKAQVLEAIVLSDDPAFNDVDLIDISTPETPVTSSGD